MLPAHSSYDAQFADGKFLRQGHVCCASSAYAHAFNIIKSAGAASQGRALGGRWHAPCYYEGGLVLNLRIMGGANDLNECYRHRSDAELVGHQRKQNLKENGPI